VATVEFDNGCMATVTSGGNCPTFYSHLILQGANAVLEISPHGGRFRVDRKKPDPLQITKVPRNWPVPTVTPARNFADVILGRAEPRCTGELGIRLSELMDALYASAGSGRAARTRPTDK
jgi:predicted dehydrogenase